MAAARCVRAVSNDALGASIWRVGEDGVARMVLGERAGQCGVAVVEVYDADDELVAETYLGPGLTVHYVAEGGRRE